MTAGFDTGGYRANLTVRAADSGDVTYFAVPFPEECTVRIVSNRAPYTLERKNTSSRICYFNGADRDLSFKIRVQGNLSGSVTSPMIPTPLTGDSEISIPYVNPEVIELNGPIETVNIKVIGDVRKSQNLLETLSEEPRFLQLEPHWTFLDVISKPAVVVGEVCVMVFGLIAMRIYFLRRQMRQRSMKENEDLPLIHSCEEQPLMHTEYMSVASSVGEVIGQAIADAVESHSENSDG
jgi:hypothetical protein